MSLSILRFYLNDQQYDRKIERNKKAPEMFFADGNLLYSLHKIYDVFISQILLLMANCFILDRHFLKVPSALLYLKTTYQHIFAFASIFALHKAG